MTKKAIHVVFPIPGQDVAGIRTKAKADGLKLYNPDAYAAQSMKLILDRQSTYSNSL